MGSSVTIASSVGVRSIGGVSMKWYWTPKGWLIVIIAVGFLAGAAFVNMSGKNEIVSNIMLVLGLLTLIFGYSRTLLNAHKKEKK